MSENMKIRQISAGFDVCKLFHSTSRKDGAYWDGRIWAYDGREYRSLRVMKSTTHYKINEFLANTMAEEIRKEIDKELVDILVKTAKL